MWSFSDSDLDVTSNHQEQFNTPCIASPFGATAPPGVQRKRSFNHGISRKSNKSMSKKSLQQWLRLQEVHHRIRDCEDENEKFELYISKLLHTLQCIIYINLYLFCCNSFFPSKRERVFGQALDGNFMEFELIRLKICTVVCTAN